MLINKSIFIFLLIFLGGCANIQSSNRSIDTGIDNSRKQIQNTPVKNNNLKVTDRQPNHKNTANSSYERNQEIISRQRARQKGKDDLPYLDGVLVSLGKQDIVCKTNLATGKIGGGISAAPVLFTREFEGKHLKMTNFYGSTQDNLIYTFRGNMLTAYIANNIENYELSNGNNGPCFRGWGDGREQCLSIGWNNTDGFILIDDLQKGSCKYLTYGKLKEVSTQEAEKLVKQDAMRQNNPHLPFKRNYIHRELLNSISQSENLESDNYQIDATFVIYISEFDKKCHDYLPKNAATYNHVGREYTKTEYGTNAWGNIKTTNYYRLIVSRSLKIKPELHQLYTSAINESFIKLFRLWDKSGRDIPFTSLVQLLGQFTSEMEKDIGNFFLENGCNSKTVFKFEKNLTKALSSH